MKKKENSDYIEISNIFEQKSPIYKKVLRPYAVGFGIRAEPIVKGIAFKRPGRLDQFTYT